MFASGEITLAEYLKYENGDKNMNYEEKYKQALGWMQSLYKGLHGITKEEAEHYFPELKESEDERIRKELIEQICYIPPQQNELTEDLDTLPCYEERIERYRAWLEKQGEPEDKGEISDGYHTFNELYSYRMLYNAAFFNLLPKQLVHKSKRHHDGEECFGGGWFIVMANLPTGQISNHYELKDWDLFKIPEKEIADEWDGHTPQEAAERLHKYLLEKQNEQPTDKVEPKFKVGDWLQYRHAEPFLVEEITEQGYCKGDSCLPFECEDEIHLWSINDAKDGDVLVPTSIRNCPFIYRKTDHNNNLAYFYAGIDGNGNFCEGCIKSTLYHFGSASNVAPATKEQRDLLFQKMKEAGWEWDCEKKELKKIEHKTLNADEVIEWLKTKVYDDSTYGRAMIDQFKKDF